MFKTKNFYILVFLHVTNVFDARTSLELIGYESTHNQTNLNTSPIQFTTQKRRCALRYEYPRKRPITSERGLAAPVKRRRPLAGWARTGNCRRHLARGPETRQIIEAMRTAPSRASPPLIARGFLIDWEIKVYARRIPVFLVRRLLVAALEYFCCWNKWESFVCPVFV